MRIKTTHIVKSLDDLTWMLWGEAIVVIYAIVRPIPREELRRLLVILASTIFIMTIVRILLRNKISKRLAEGNSTETHNPDK